MTSHSHPETATTRSWHKSSYSGGGGNNCVEHASTTDGTQHLRDSKDVSRPSIAVSPGAFASFLGYAKSQQV